MAAPGRASGGYPPGHRDRRVALAILASLLLHALILYLFPGLLDASRSRRPPPGPIVARLVQPQPAAEPPPVAAAPAQPKPESSLRPVPKPLPAPPVLSAPAPAAAAPSIAVPTPAPRAAEPAPAAPSAPANPAPAAKAEPAPGQAAPAAAVAPPSAGESADPATVGQYRIAVIAAARRYKRYPRIAMDNNWEGQAEIRLVIGTDGNIASISIKTKSGFEVLDQQALEMIRRAKPQAPIPAALRGKGFTIDVPVVFSLREEGG
ncbi:MAG: energy transducer TonB [Proteobacteria bacterium]|nr:energy transducer TonB [Pseudomonadota bacterium]